MVHRQVFGTFVVVVVALSWIAEAWSLFFI
jgi:hypothetical protein